jgi:hypothetical protein
LTASQMNRLPNPFAASVVVSRARSSIGVMCASTPTWWNFTIRDSRASTRPIGTPSQASRSIGESVDPSRSIEVSRRENSDSITSARCSIDFPSLGDRWVTSPSPDPRPGTTRSFHAG